MGIRQDRGADRADYVPPLWRNQGPPAPVIVGPPAPTEKDEPAPAKPAGGLSDWQKTILRGQTEVADRLLAAYGLQSVDLRLARMVFWELATCTDDVSGEKIRRVDAIIRSHPHLFTKPPDTTASAAASLLKRLKDLDRIAGSPFFAFGYGSQIALGRSHEEAMMKGALADLLFVGARMKTGFGLPNYRRGEYNERFAPTPRPRSGSPTHQPVR